MLKIKGIFLLFFYALILAKTLYIIIIQKERQVDMKEIKIDNIYVATDNIVEMYSDGYTNSESICILEKTDNNIEHKHILLTIYIDIKSNKYLYISKDGVVLPRKENIKHGRNLEYRAVFTNCINRKYKRNIRKNI